MKKFLAVLLCAVMLVGTLSAGAFAASSESDVPGTGETQYPVVKTAYSVSIINPTVLQQSINAGDVFNVSFSLNGNQTTTWVNSEGMQSIPFSTWDPSARTTVSLSGAAGFSLAGSLAEMELQNGLNTIPILSDGSLASGRYQVTLTVTCQPKSGAAVTDQRTFNIDVEASQVELDEKGDAPKFSLKNATIPEGKGKSNLATKLKLTLSNDSSFPASDVSITLSGLGGLILNTYTDTIQVGEVGAEKTINATFPVKFPEYPELQTTLTASVKYKDAAGNEHTDTFNIYLQANEKEKEETKDDKSLDPKVIVSKYSLDVEKIISGEEFTLTFVLKNTSHDRDIMNMTVDVDTSSSGSSGSGGMTNDTVFSPIDGTTSFYTEVLERDGELEYTIRLKTSASAGAKSYPIRISYDFQYEKNGAYTTSGNNSMTINLPVTQPIKFELTEWYPPTICYSSSGANISFQYINKSKNPMTNLTATVEGDFNMPAQFLGTLNATNMNYFNGVIMPNDPTAIGETKQAVLVFTFEDASSNEQRVEYPFEMTIAEDAAPAPGDMQYNPSGPGMDIDIVGPGYEDPGMNANGGEVSEGGLPGWAKYAIGGGILAVIAVIIIVVVVVLKKRKSQDDYDDDEE